MLKKLQIWGTMPPLMPTIGQLKAMWQFNWPNLVANFGTNASGDMQVAPSGGQICSFCKWRHLVAKFAANASGAMLLLNLIHFTESISGSVVLLAMFLNLIFLCFICTTNKMMIFSPRVFVNSIFEIEVNHTLPETKTELIE